MQSSAVSFSVSVHSSGVSARATCSGVEPQPQSKVVSRNARLMQERRRSPRRVSSALPLARDPPLKQIALAESWEARSLRSYRRSLAGELSSRLDWVVMPLVRTLTLLAAFLSAG